MSEDWLLKFTILTDRSSATSFTQANNTNLDGSLEQHVLRLSKKWKVPKVLQSYSEITRSKHYTLKRQHLHSSDPPAKLPTTVSWRSTLERQKHCSSGSKNPGVTNSVKLCSTLSIFWMICFLKCYFVIKWMIVLFVKCIHGIHSICYCYCLLLLLQRSLSVPLRGTSVYCIDGHHIWLLRSFKTYCTVLLMDVPCMTATISIWFDMLRDTYLRNWFTDEIDCFKLLKGHHSLPLYTVVIHWALTHCICICM